mgnify:FL=1
MVDTLVGLIGTWRERNLRQCLSTTSDWSELALNLAVEAPIVDSLLRGVRTTRMERDLTHHGLVPEAVPLALLTFAWERHLESRVRLQGADAAIVKPSHSVRPVQDRLALRTFVGMAMKDLEGDRAILVPSCGAGYLLLLAMAQSTSRGIQLFGIDQDPRAVLFAERLLERERVAGQYVRVMAAHPLVESDLYNDPLALLIPRDARERLQAADWSTLFDGIDRFDRVLIGYPFVSLTLRQAVRRHVQDKYADAGQGTDPSFLLLMSSVRRLKAGGRIYALFPKTAFRAGTDIQFRRWLGARTEILVNVPSSRGTDFCLVCASCAPLKAPIRIGKYDGISPVLSTYPRQALDPDSWTVSDPAQVVAHRLFEECGAPLGDILLGGIRIQAPALLDPSLLLSRCELEHLLRADSRIARVVRPFVTRDAIVPFGSVRTISRFVLAGRMPPRARKRALDRGIASEPLLDLPPPAGPRLLFAEGGSIPAFLWDREGCAVPGRGIGVIAPGDLYLAGLLQAEPFASFIQTRCNTGLSPRCLARLPVLLPDPYEERERCLGIEIASLASRRIALTGSPDLDAIVRQNELEDAITKAISRLYGLSSD